MEEAKKKGKRMRKSRTDISDIEYVSANRKRWFFVCVTVCDCSVRGGLGDL